MPVTNLVFTYTIQPSENANPLVVTALNLNGGTIGDGNGPANLNDIATSFANLQVDTTAPTITSIAASPATGDYPAGQLIQITVSFSEPVNVTGTPTLTLNSGASATYVSGSGTATLIYNYTTAVGQNANPLAVTSSSGTITDFAGNALVTNVGNIGTPFLIFNNNGAHVTSGAQTGGTSVDAPAGSLVVVAIAVPLGSHVGTLLDSTTNSYSLANQTVGNQEIELWYCRNVLHMPIGTTFTATVIGGGAFSVYSGAAAVSNANAGLDQTAGKNVTSSLNFSPSIPIGPFVSANEVVFATLNFSSFTSYVEDASFTNLVPGFLSGNGTPFSYLALSTTAAIAWAPSWSGSDSPAGALASFTGGGANTVFTGLQVDTIIPSVTATTPNPATGNIGSGASITITLTMSETVFVTGTPQLVLNSGGIAAYASGSGTAALVFNYSVSPGDSANPLAVSGINLNGGTILDGATNVANLNAALVSFGGLTINSGGAQVIASIPLGTLFPTVVSEPNATKVPNADSTIGVAA